jgi:glucose-6-phosphate 1-dehydrogenase
MTARTIAVEPFDIVVFGGTGDLARRKLLPALFYRFAAGQAPGEMRIFGVARGALSEDDFRATAREAIMTHVAPADRDANLVRRFINRVHYITADAGAEGDAGWDEMGVALGAEPDRIRVFYLATAPELFGPICDRLAHHQLISERARVVVEKPIGKSLDSARAVNDAVGRSFPEDRIYRIDHYLGKETVQNLMALRFANALFDPVWNAAHIDHVQITVAETLGVEGRAGYYDTAGALRDMVQNHMLQLVCLTAMEPPTSLNADAVRDEKLKVLKSLIPITGDTVGEQTVRGQYRAGASADGPVGGYLDELGNPNSRTETFVALKLGIANWRWAGVPFFLRSGKRLPSRSARSRSRCSTAAPGRSRRTGW